ncbi:hypothetical protein BU26DRAFT_71780 [Trematosphaeria pertusa]|uniref:F-box domain-containing protein n=1 Tax=Trematosphaeria pertusa TaxID=390896 RepID=A0A6A6I5K8_9PLEO|nr:uncharacterized protein BU26DRAFT_71780 [Trematosphaeria pertusa]KAF2245607.1 hypothetical protein BU26DRAFT_71780 [Trematosphaeria pertusa]
MATPRSPQCPSLPPELWIRILSYNTDLTHLWTTCRQISHSFRAYTEQVFAESVLRDTHIDFQLEKYNLGGKSKRPEIPTSFSHFELGAKLHGGGRDKSVAWFKDKRKKGDVAGGAAGMAYKRVMQRWEENVRGWKPEMPHYTIRVGSVVNDTALPNLTINIADREIGFDWRRMFQLFFREQQRLRILKQKWHSSTAAQIQRNNARLAKGEKLAAADYPPPWPAAEVEIRKEVRRARLKEHYKHDEEMLWAIDSLAHFENHGAVGGSGTAFKINPDLPGAGVGEKWFGSVNLVQGLYLDEWSCMHRTDTKVEHLRGEGEYDLSVS